MSFLPSPGDSHANHTTQNPPLYLHITSTTKEGLDDATAKIEELMQQELPNLVDERRFRRREPDNIERDEFGRVSEPIDRRRREYSRLSVNGPRRRFLSTWSLCRDLIYAHKLWELVASM